MVFSIERAWKKPSDMIEKCVASDSGLNMNLAIQNLTDEDALTEGVLVIQKHQMAALFYQELLPLAWAIHSRKSNIL